MPVPDSLLINDQTGEFDNSQGRYNSSGRTPAAPPHFVRPAPAEQVNAPSVTPSVRSKFTGKPQPQVVVNAPAPVLQQQLAGSFSAVRAMQTLYQHAIGFWTDSGIVDMVAASNQPDPSETQIDQMYADLQLFSYLPAALVPSRSEFGDMVKPSHRSAAITARLSQMGINLKPQTIASVPAATQALIPPPPPFAQRLSFACNGRSFVTQA